MLITGTSSMMQVQRLYCFLGLFPHVLLTSVVVLHLVANRTGFRLVVPDSLGKDTPGFVIHNAGLNELLIIIISTICFL